MSTETKKDEPKKEAPKPVYKGRTGAFNRVMTDTDIQYPPDDNARQLLTERINATFAKKNVQETEVVTLSGFRFNPDPKGPRLLWVLFRVGIDERYVEVRFVDPKPGEKDKGKKEKGKK